MAPDAGDSVPRPFWLQGQRGKLLAVYYPPVATAVPLGDVLVVPPFAEEMNRCRAMVAMQARAFSRLGVGTLVLDPYGTGDSDGNFLGARWELWRDDLLRGIQWLRTDGHGCTTVWGIRLGATMALELASHDPQVRGLLLWQPVTDGKRFLTQFLRISIAAELDQADRTTSTEALRDRIRKGDLVEIGGYPMAAELIAAIDGCRMSPSSGLPKLRISWIDILPNIDSGIPRATTVFLDGAKGTDCEIDAASVIGPPFWQTHERQSAPELIAASCAAISGLLAMRGETVDRHLPTESGAPIRPCQSDADDGGESPVSFACGDETLVGMLHPGRLEQKRAIVIVVAGGPQYRAGAHRQFVELSRRLSAAGYPVLRFDLQGMGDSSGDHIGYLHSESDIRAAIDALTERLPNVAEVVLFGECESATGNLFYGFRDARVRGMIMVNPWVRTEEGRARVILKHYYWQRLTEPAFWAKLREGRFDIRSSIASLADTSAAYLRGRRDASTRSLRSDQEPKTLPLPIGTAEGMRRFGGQVLLVMSGRDYIAREFDEVIAATKAWRGLLERKTVTRRDLCEADHTFSKDRWKRQTSQWIIEWLEQW